MGHFLHRLARATLSALLAGVLAACAAPKAPATGLRTIEILAAANANGNNATALDLVFVYDSSVVALLPKSGPEWFSQKAALVAGLALSIDVVGLQLPPASTLALPGQTPFPARYAKAVGVYAFANYVAPAGQAPFNLTPFGTVSIMLAPDNMTVKGEAPPKSMLKKLLDVF